MTDTQLAASQAPVKHWLFNAIFLQNEPALQAWANQPDVIIPKPSPSWGTYDKVSIRATYTSAANFQAAIAQGQHPAADWLLYDCEHWPLTPAAEQADPLTYCRHFARIAHDHGYKVLFTPARNLYAHPGGQSGYLQSDLFAAATFVDGFVIQSQNLQYYPTEMVATLLGALNKLRANNPKCLVLGGLTTCDAAGHPWSAAELIAFYQRFSDLDGWWLNNPVRGPADPTGPAVPNTQSMLGLLKHVAGV